MAKKDGSDHTGLPATDNGGGGVHRESAFSILSEFHFNLMLFDSDLTLEELELVDGVAKRWCAQNDCECEARATEHGFVIRLRHCEPDASVFQNRLSDALRRDAFSQIGKGFVPV